MVKPVRTLSFLCIIFCCPFASSTPRDLASLFSGAVGFSVDCFGGNILQVQFWVQKTEVLEYAACRFVLGTISSQRLGLPGANVSGIAAEHGLGSATAPVDRAPVEDPSLGDLNTPFYRMRFGRDLRLAEVRWSDISSSFGSEVLSVTALRYSSLLSSLHSLSRRGKHIARCSADVNDGIKNQ
jgi:hypothetical protein